MSAGFEYLRAMSDHDLIDAYCYAGAVLGHGVEPWLVWPLSDWLTEAKTELQHRGLFKDAERVERAMWKDHHARKAEFKHSTDLRPELYMPRSKRAL